MAKKKPIQQPGVPEWVLTYGDLMSLLLCFFILLAAFSELKKPREYIKVIESIQEALGFKGGRGVMPTNEQTRQQLERLGISPSIVQETQKDRDETHADNVTGEAPSTNVVHEGNRFAQGGSIPFAAGSADLDEAAKALLHDQIAPLIRGQRYLSVVVGHAWGFEDKASGLSFDELSFQRADAVKDYLVRECAIDEGILRIEAAGATEPAQIDPTAPEAGALNRRVQVWMTGRVAGDTSPDPNLTKGVAP
ncbi:MAG: flagellar motor protein MotB [Phycisphaerales bacterium]